jgi:hypothetical protein
MKTACIAALLLASSLFALTGCDDASPANETLRINPTAAALRTGESATFTASGGYDYTWSMQQPWGHLSALTGPTVTYTSLYDPGVSSNAFQVLTVVSTIPDQHRAETNTIPPSTQISAEAYITHLSSNSPSIP